MSESLEIRTSHRDVSEVVRELAPFVDDTSLRLPSGRKIADGDWVRFSVHLVDGSAVLEGVGRCQESTQEGASTFRVRLSLLSFDARNEVMYERMLLAGDADGGEATGTIDIRALGEKILKQPPTPPPKSVPPPAPPRAKPLTRPPPLPRASTRPPPPLPKKSTMPPPASQIPKARAPSVPAKPVPRAHLDAKPREPSPRQRRDTSTGDEAPRPATPVPPPVESQVPEERAVPRDTPRVEMAAEEKTQAASADVAIAPTAELTSPSVATPESITTDTVISNRADLTPIATHSGLRMEIPARLVERARALAPTLPPGLASPTPGRETTEEAVLRAALRIGLASLAALSDVDDEP